MQNKISEKMFGDGLENFHSPPYKEMFVIYFWALKHVFKDIHLPTNKTSKYFLRHLPANLVTSNYLNPSPLEYFLHFNKIILILFINYCIFSLLVEVIWIILRKAPTIACVVTLNSSGKLSELRLQTRFKLFDIRDKGRGK